VFNKIIIATILGISAGILTGISKGILFIILLIIAAYYCIQKFSVKKDQQFLTLIFIIGVSVRIIMSVLQDGIALLFFPDSYMAEIVGVKPLDNSFYYLIQEKTRAFFSVHDSDYVSIRGYLYNAYVRGIDNIVIQHYLFGSDSVIGYAWNGYFHVIGIFYYLFGYSPITVKFINCLLGALIPILIYAIGKNFNKSSDKIACCLVMFFPSLIIWSTTNLKDTSVVFVSIIMLWSAIEFLKTNKIRYLLWISLCIFLQKVYLVRDLWILSIVFIVIIFLIYYFQRTEKKILLVTSFIVLYLLLPTHTKNSMEAYFKEKIHYLYVSHMGHVGTRGVSYKILDDEYYKNPRLLDTMNSFAVVKSSSRALYHFMLEPFPKRVSNLFFLVTFPQMVLWYLLIPFIFIGIFEAVKNNHMPAIVVLTHTIVFTFVISIASGNVGTLFRHRDLITPFYLIFAANGLSKVMEMRNKEAV
jgi:hypothetical protein